MSVLLLLLWVCGAGALLALRLDETSKRRSEALALGAPIGLALFAGFGFVLGWVFGLSALTVSGAAVATMAVGIAAGARPNVFWERRGARPRAGVLVLSLLGALVVARLADRTLFAEGGGILTGDHHNLGDLPFHIGIAAGFAYGDNFPPQHPELAGVPLTYPFFCDLLSAMILAVGGSWRDAFFWPTLILGLSVVVAVVRFGEEVTGSRALGRVAGGLTFFSGGFGFLALANLGEMGRWWSGSADLTMNETGLRYANFITTLFIPQRSILFGWPLLFFALALLVRSLKTAEPGEALPPQLWRGAGIIGSLLPLVHAHSFVVLCFCALLFAFRASIRAILSFAFGLLPLALPAILYMLSHNSLAAPGFVAWQPGFDGAAAQPLRFWLDNAGFFFPLVILGLTRPRSIQAPAWIAAPFAGLFLLANLFRLSPWIWDNMKFLAPAHAGLAPFAALALARVWDHSRAGKAGALLAFVIATLSGGLDVAKLAAAGGEFRIFDRNDLAFAVKVREATSPDTVILTAPTHNHPVLLSGRREFLGYEGHLWSQGLEYAERKEVAAALFKGEGQDETSLDLPRIGAVAVTPAEGSLIGDQSLLAGLPSLVDSPYRLLKVQ